LYRMQADCCFNSSDDVGPATAALIERGVNVETLDDDQQPSTSIRVQIITELDVEPTERDEGQFHHSVQSIVDLFDGAVMEVAWYASTQT
jgi:hypothetical protein